MPHKNIRRVNGRPLIGYAIGVALACSRISTTIVTTDSPDIRQVALTEGAEAPFLRPPELATDLAKQEDAILHAMRWYESEGRRSDLVCLLEPTVPLRRAATVEAAFALLDGRPDADAVLSVTECDVPPVVCNTLRPDGSMRDWMDERYKWANRQEVPAFYKPSGLVAISRWDAFLSTRTFLQDGTLAMVVDKVESRNVDTALDLLIVERLVELGLSTSEDVESFMRR